MLSKILKKSDCASCKFCCSFRRQSLWETPLFSKTVAARLAELYPSAKFRPAGKDSLTIDLSDAYKTDDSEEEAACPFLNSQTGCILPAELKPFECSIWPLRPVYSKGEIAVALTPTCPAVNKAPHEAVEELLQEGLGRQIIAYAEKNPDIIKESSDFLSDIVYTDLQK